MNMKTNNDWILENAFVFDKLQWLIHHFLVFETSIKSKQIMIISVNFILKTSDFHVPQILIY